MIDAKLLRIVTGEEVIAEIISEDENTITIQNGLVVLPTAQQFGFAPWASVIDTDKPEITLSKNHVVYVAELNQDVKKRYNEVYGSKLVTPDKKKLIV